MVDRVRRALPWVWERLDTLVALLLALVVSIGGLSDKIEPTTVATWTLATLAIVAFSLMRDRSERIHLRKSVEALERSGTADALFTYASDDMGLLSEAHHSIDLLQETGNLVLERGKSHLVTLLKAGGSVRVVLTAESDTIAGLMALRNWDLDPAGIRNRWHGRDAQLASLVGAAGASARNLEVRYLAYPVGGTLAIADARPKPSTARILVREAGFRVTFDDKPDFLVSNRTAPKAYALYSRQFDLAYLASSKLVLLEGPPRSGKSSILWALIQSVGLANAHVAWVSSKELLDNNQQRVGFSVQTSLQASTQFATRLPDGSYDSNDQVFDDVASYLMKALDDGQVIIVDEIGPIQLRSQRFREVVERIRVDKGAFVIASAGTAPVAGVVPLQESHRSRIVTLGGKVSVATIEQLLLDEATNAVRTVEFLKAV